MNTILIVEDSAAGPSMIRKNLEPYAGQFNFLAADNSENATKILKEQQILTMITDLDMSKMDGVELLDHMGREHPEVPCIVVTDFNNHQSLDLLQKKHVYRVIEKPVGKEKLVEAILDARAQFEENPVSEGMALVAAFKLIDQQQRSCMLEAFSPMREKGVLYFVRGALYEAACGYLTGEKAVTAMIGWDNPTAYFKRLPDQEIKRSISISLQSLINVDSRRQAEAAAENGYAIEEAVEQNQPVDLLAKAVLRAESLDLKGARGILASILKNNPRDEKAWLWFSRVADNMKRIAISLENAYKISPDDPEVIEESKKIRVGIQAGCPENGDVKRCPFCWTPITETIVSCPFCKAHYSIDKKLFNSSQQANEQILGKATQSFTIAILLEKNANTCFHLALAYANLGKWSKSIDMLEKTISIEPESKFYRQQLRNLREYVADLKSICKNSEATEEAIVAGVANDSYDNKKKILVVDDSAVTRKVVRGIFTHSGFEVLEAQNGLEAMECFKNAIPDLVLLDIIMPEMDGYEVLSALKKNKALKDIPVIMLTARDSLMDKIKGKMSASNEYLTKPFTPEELLAKVKKYVE